ncbi:contractile injection system protein, VgrG/Pvc8 family [Brucella sp. 10RB9213]|uniref:phage late control D family protein n=1 Tax=Brucella sp. 10RB9213 TaxID=1844039 RepID=UPI0012ADDF35|nr:contractile injection system protein, VgrG/Pvc8 family [Brucella sp. 10RB9213]MRN67875.1 late control protein [Brucella sp. 10RB9213]
MERSHPFIEVSIEGKTVHDAFYQRLVSATIRDEPGQSADTLELVFDDTGNEIDIPQKGAKIEIRFGFKGVGTWKMGTFVFERASYNFGSDGERLTFSCKSAELRADVKEPLSEHFDGATIGQIVEQLAKRHGYKAKVSPELANTKLDYIARANQSAVDFLTRLADRTGALFSIKDNTFLFLKRGSLPPITITKGDCSEGEFSIEPRPKYGKAAAGWYDRRRNKTVYEEHATGLYGPTRRLRTVYASQAEAKKAAEAEGARLARATGQGSLTMAGWPEVMADAPINAVGFRKEFDGEWRAASVEHRFEDTYTTSIELEAPEKGKE